MLPVSPVVKKILPPQRYNTLVSPATTPAPQAAPTPPRPFTLWQRFLLGLITWAGFLVIRLIGPTLRLAVSIEEGGPASLDTRPMVLSFWHDCIFPATYVWRNLGIRVLSSDSFDGEYTGRIIRKFGFVKVRGSSSRGAVRALLGMRREIEQGATVAFTIDGPKGPRHVAKPGPVLLAGSTGAPMVAFHIAVAKWLDAEYLGPFRDPETVFPRVDADQQASQGPVPQRPSPAGGSSRRTPSLARTRARFRRSQRTKSRQR